MSASDCITFKRYIPIKHTNDAVTDEQNYSMYRYSICDPLNPKAIEMGDIRKDKVWNLFINFPWKTYYDKMEEVGHENIHDSPSLEIENKENGTAVTLSLVNMEDGLEFYIFYLRPKKVSMLFGLIKYTRTCLTDKIDQTEQDAHDAIQALLKEDLKTLEERWG